MAPKKTKKSKAPAPPQAPAPKRDPTAVRFDSDGSIHALYADHYGLTNDPNPVIAPLQILLDMGRTYLQ